MAAVLVIPSAFAVGTGSPQDSGLFQLDGNTLPGTCATTFPATTTTGGDDWAALYNGLPSAHPCGSDAFTFVNDGVGAADGTYWSGGGSKDAYDPALGPWQWAPNDVSPDKNDLDNAFAAIYHVPSTSTKFLYFGSDRFTTNGDAQQGFQFLQANSCLAGAPSTLPGGGACPSSTPTTFPSTCSPSVSGSNVGRFVDPDTGCPVHHQNGDLLILVNFNNGGTLGLAGVYEWSGANGSGAGSYSQVLTGTGANCATVTTPDDFCSIANTGNLSNEPVWAYTAKGTTGQATYSPSAFIEGGVNLAHIPGAGTCFPTFVAESRSSAGPSSGLSLQAQLKDLVFGKFQLCGSSMSTTPKDGSGSDIPTDGLSIGTGTVTATDSAHLVVSGTSAFSGTLKFFLCGPIPSTDAVGTCTPTTSGTPAVTVNTGLQIGSTQNISQATTGCVVGASIVCDLPSAQALLTSAGKYCWRGVFTSSTAGVPSRTDSSSGECFTVNPVTPSLVTTAVDCTSAHTAISAPVDFGTSVCDKGTLGGSGVGQVPTATQPGTTGSNSQYPSIYQGTDTPTLTPAGGKITFTLKGPDTTGPPFVCSTTTASKSAGTNPEDVTGISGDGDYFTTGVTPASPGPYHWVAQYVPVSTDVNNVGSTYNNACGDSAEAFTVRLIPTALVTKQSWFPNDTATIISTVSGDNLGAGGTVDFTLYNDGTCGGGTGTAQYTERQTLVGGSHQETVRTHNYTGSTAKTPANVTVTPFEITTLYGDAADSSTGSYSWKVVYTPASADSVHTGISSACTTGSLEKFSTTYTNDNSGSSYASPALP